MGYMDELTRDGAGAELCGMIQLVFFWDISENDSENVPEMRLGQLDKNSLLVLGVEAIDGVIGISCGG